MRLSSTSSLWRSAPTLPTSSYLRKPTDHTPSHISHRMGQLPRVQIPLKDSAPSLHACDRLVPIPPARILASPTGRNLPCRIQPDLAIPCPCCSYVQLPHWLQPRSLHPYFALSAAFFVLRQLLLSASLLDPLPMPWSASTPRASLPGQPWEEQQLRSPRALRRHSARVTPLGSPSKNSHGRSPVHTRLLPSCTNPNPAIT